MRYNTQFRNYMEVHCVITGEQKGAPNPAVSIWEQRRKYAKENFLQWSVSPALKSKQELAKDKGTGRLSQSENFRKKLEARCIMIHMETSKQFGFSQLVSEKKDVKDRQAGQDH